jgi:glutamyl-tRNA reductase
MLVLIGANHRSAPVDVRERLVVDTPELAERLRLLVGQNDMQGACWLSTCNRIEVIVHCTDVRRGEDSIRRALQDVSGFEPRQLERYSYRHIGVNAPRHLFRVTSGLDSMILGEPQIAGQLKSAYMLARHEGALSSTLDRLFQSALACSKAVRTQTGISRHPVSVAFTAVELAQRIFGKMDGRTVLLLGAGKMAGLVGEHLRGRGADRIMVASRRFATAESRAKSLGGEALHWDDALRRLPETDVVISGTGAMNRILEVKDVKKLTRHRRGRPLLLIDIAVPRDIDPAVKDLNNVYLYDIDALQSVVDSGLEKRQAAAAEAEELIEQAVEDFQRWRRSAAIGPTIAELTDACHRIGRTEIERFRRRLGRLDDDQEQALRELSRGIVKKLLHHPIRQIRNDAGLPGGFTTERVRELFGLEEGSPDEAESEDSKGPSHALDGGRES